MPTPRSPRGRSQRQPLSPAQQLHQQQQSEFKFDSMDIMVGVLLLIVIPFATHLILRNVGLPVSGKTGLSYEESLEQQAIIEQKKKFKAPLEPREFEMQMAEVRRIVDQQVPQYLKRATQEDHTQPRRVEPWIAVANSANEDARRIVESLIDAIENNSAFNSSHRGRLSTYRDRIDALEKQIDAADPFSRLQG